MATILIELPFRWRCSIYRMEERTGVHSVLYNEPEKHALLWDFDNTNLFTVEKNLKLIQSRYNLPSIYIVESSIGNYHGYCFCRREFQEIIEILSATRGIDLMHLKLGILRGYFTLRISRRNNDKFRLVKILVSKVPDETSRMALTVGEYLTSNKGGHHV